MKNHFKWLRLIIFLPLLLAIPFVNYWGDAAAVFDENSSEMMAEEIVNGSAVYFTTGNGDERGVKKNLIISMPNQVDTIAVGGSIVMCVYNDIVGTESFYNLSVSSADFYDILAQFGIMDIYEKKIDRVIFCVSSHFFDEELYSTSTLNEKLKPYAEYMINILDGEESKADAIEENNTIKTQIEQLFSISYFQSSLSAIKDNIFNAGYGIVDNNFGDLVGYYMPDGSWVYPSDTVNQTEIDVIDHANEYDIDNQFSKGTHISAYSKKYFEKLIQFCMENNVEVDLFLCPLAPALWDRIDNDADEFPLIYELEDYVNEMADKYDLKITGSYNPYTLGISNAEFYDCRHVRKEVLSKYFDFTPQSKLNK